MFVELGSSADAWRPHIVRGILGSYGIDAVLWHEQAVHIYAPGWGARAIIVVHEDDVEDALEILRAAPGPPEQLDITVGESAPTLLPSLRASIEGSVIAFTTLVLIELAIHLFTHISEHARSHPSPPLADALTLSPLGAPLAALACGLLSYLMMLPLRTIKSSVWIALASYLWVRVLLWLLAFALALCVL